MPNDVNELEGMVMQASAQGDVEWLQEVLSKGLPVTSVVSKDGKTPLMVASSNGHHAVATMLLQHGLSTEAKDRVSASV
jgi:ankyrin repeat protein